LYFSFIKKKRALSFHPNICRLLGFTDSPPSTILKLYACSYADIIFKLQSDLPMVIKLGLLTDIAAGMETVHRANVVSYHPSL